jgi:hypothetical protein
MTSARTLRLSSAIVSTTTGLFLLAAGVNTLQT